MYGFRTIKRVRLPGQYGAKASGLVITETFKKLNPQKIPAVLVANHGPFVWGHSPLDAVHHAVIVEYLTKLELHVRQLNPDAPQPSQHLIEKHYLRKNGEEAYYGQRPRN